MFFLLYATNNWSYYFYRGVQHYFDSVLLNALVQRINAIYKVSKEDNLSGHNTSIMC